MKLSLLLPFSFFLLARTAWGAACCGGGFAAPSVISGDDRAQFSASYSSTNVVIDNVDPSGFWRRWDEHQQIRTMRIEGAHLISDRWQMGGALPFVSRSKQSQSYSGLGDLSATLAYEYLPDWDYNPVRPKGICFLQITAPTGKSKFESDVGGLDSRGNGLWAVGFGTLLTKAIGGWDAFANMEIHRSLEKTISSSQVNGTLKPGFGGNVGVGGGYNTASWRFGGSITWTYEDPIALRGSTNIEGSLERYATAVAAVSFLASDEWVGTLSYADQTLFGSPTNTSLGRTIAFQLQRRWGR